MAGHGRSVGGWRLAAAAGTLAALLAVVPVMAAPLTHELSRTTEVGVEELCDAPWDVVTTSTTLFMLKGSDEPGVPPKFFVRQRIDAVYRDPADAARGFVISWNDVYADLHVTHVDGTVYAFDAVESGVQRTLSTLDGTVISRNRGHLTWTFLVDTQGSSDPDDYELLDVVEGSIRGPHPEGGDVSCDEIAAALGD